MRKTHDKTANATYYCLEPTTARKISKTVPVSSRCNVDVDEEGYPIGVEVLLG